MAHSVRSAFTRISAGLTILAGILYYTGHQIGEHPVLGSGDAGFVVDAGFPDTGVDAGFPDSGVPNSPSDEVILFSSYGQSPAIGVGGTPALSTSQVYGNLGWTNTALAPLVEGTLGLGDVETLCSGLCNSFSYFQSGRMCVCDPSGVSGQTLENLSQGTANYNSAQAEFDEAHDAFVSAYPGTGSRPGPLFFTGGEANNFAGTAESTYCSLLLALQADWETDTNAAWGASFVQPLMISQLGNWSSASVGLNGSSSAASTAIHQYNCVRDNPTRLIMVGPTYQLPSNSDGIHPNNTGHRRDGELKQKALRTWAAGNDWLPLQPIRGSISCVDNVITVPFEGGEQFPPVLQIDTSSITRREMGGVAYWETTPQDDLPVVTSTAVVDNNLVVTLNRNCDTDGRVRYAYYNVPRTGRQSTCTGAGCAGGNLHNTNSARAFNEAIQSWDWSVAFDEAITCPSGCTPSAVSAFARNFSYRSDDSPTGYLSGGLGPTAAFAGSQRMSFCGYIRAAVWYASGTRNILGAMATNRSMWGLRFGTSAGQLRWYISASTNDFTTNYVTPASTFVANTWYHVCGALDGTQADGPDVGSDANDERVNFWVNAVELTGTGGTFNGTIPANLTSVITDFAIGSWSEGTLTNGETQFAHWAFWHDVTLTQSDVTTLYNGGTPISPIGLLGTDPTFYLPLQRNLEVKGRNNYYFARYGVQGGVWQPGVSP